MASQQELKGTGGREERGGEEEERGREGKESYSLISSSVPMNPALRR
jgi:hypothetical protein